MPSDYRLDGGSHSQKASLKAELTYINGVDNATRHYTWLERRDFRILSSIGMLSLCVWDLPKYFVRNSANREEQVFRGMLMFLRMRPVTAVKDAIFVWRCRISASQYFKTRSAYRMFSVISRDSDGCWPQRYFVKKTPLSPGWGRDARFLDRFWALFTQHLCGGNAEVHID